MEYSKHKKMLTFKYVIVRLIIYLSYNSDARALTEEGGGRLLLHPKTMIFMLLHHPLHPFSEPPLPILLITIFLYSSSLSSYTPHHYLPILLITIFLCSSSLSTYTPHHYLPILLITIFLCSSSMSSYAPHQCLSMLLSSGVVNMMQTHPS